MLSYVVAVKFLAFVVLFAHVDVALGNPDANLKDSFISSTL